MKPTFRRAALLAAPLLALAACNIGGPDNEEIVDEDVLNSTLLPELPRPLAPLDRAALIDAIDAAASSFVLHADDREAQAQLVNRKFVLRLPFACTSSATPAGASLTAKPSADGKSLALAATPDIGPANLGTDSKIDDAEGFWIAAPWVRDERCPSPVARPAPTVGGGAPLPDSTPPMRDEFPLAAVSEKTAAFVQFYGPDDKKLGPRSGKAYEANIVLAAGKPVPSGLALVVEGRLRPFPTGQVIRCRKTADGLRPSCFVSIQADRVAFEQLADHSILAEWKNVTAVK